MRNGSRPLGAGVSGGWRRHVAPIRPRRVLGFGALGLVLAAVTALTLAARDADRVAAQPGTTTVPAADEPATIRIEKATTPVSVPDQFQFSTVGLPAGSFSLGAQDPPRVFDNLVPGRAYSITEIVPSGWILLDAGGTGCTRSGAATVTVTPSPGQVVTCRFTNANANVTSITANLVTVPATSTEVFDLVLDPPPFGGPDIPFQLTGGGTRTFNNPVPGLLFPYRITEQVPPGWSLSVTGSRCVQQGNSVLVFPIPFVATTCTLTNTATSTITIDTTAVGADGRFDFTEATLGPRSVDTVNGTGSVTYPNVAPGRYDFGEVVPEGWQAGPFGGACAADGTITVTGDAPSDRRCTITNTRQTGSVTFAVDTIGGDPDTPFVFDVTGATGGSDDIAVPTSGGSGSVTRTLPVGEYALALPPKFGWANGTISCVPTTESPVPVAILTVTPGANTTCSVSNTKLASLVIRTVTNPAGHPATFSFGASSGLSPAFFSLGDGQVQRIDNITPINLTPSPVAVNEVVPAGWSLATTGTGCTPTSTGITISPAPGAMITCTFTNTLVAPVIAISPSEVPPGGTIVIDLGGLPPGETVGIEILDGTGRIVGTFVLVVGPDGQVEGNFSIPSGYPPGRYSARVVGPGFPSVTQTFTVADPTACPLCVTPPVRRPVTSGAVTPLAFTGGDGVDLGTVGLSLIATGSLLVAIGRRQRNRRVGRPWSCGVS